MRKLKLQMFMSIDGFIAGPNGEQADETLSTEPPPESEIDEEMENYILSTIDTSDTILLGRKTVNEFVTYWENIANNQPEHPEFELAKKLVATPKVVFSKTLKESIWDNTTLASGNIIDEINRLKNQIGKDMIAYGGGGFASSLIKEGLIDEYYLFFNAHAIGQGMPIFHRLTQPLYLDLKSVTAFNNGVVLHVYEPKRD